MRNDRAILALTLVRCPSRPRKPRHSLLGTVALAIFLEAAVMVAAVVVVAAWRLL